MAKTTIIILFVIGLVLSAVIFYAANQLISANAAIDSYNVRKEDTYLSQQRIEQSLSALNQTLQAELAYQNTLAASVTNLYSKANLAAPSSSNGGSVQTAPTPAPVPAPVVTPAPAPVSVPVSRPVTRAS